nr:hypothetical protein [Dromedary stool-associated circular ssDNA virus]
MGDEYVDRAVDFIHNAVNRAMIIAFRGIYDPTNNLLGAVPYIGPYLREGMDWTYTQYINKMSQLGNDYKPAGENDQFLKYIENRFPGHAKYREELRNKQTINSNKPIETIVKKTNNYEPIYKQYNKRNINKNGELMVYTRPTLIPKTWQRRAFQRRLKRYQKRFRRYKGVNSADSYVFDSYTNYNVNAIQNVRFEKAISIRDILSSCVLWTQTAPLYSQFKITYLTLEIRQILAPRYFLNMPVLAINCLYNVNDPTVLTFNEVRSSTGSKVYHMEKNYYVYRHRFRFTNSPSPGLGKYCDLDKSNSSSFIPTDACLTNVFLFSNVAYIMDLNGLPGGTSDDIESSKACMTLHWRLWVKLKGKMQ